jgi:thiamine-phosphate diphosphorylase
LGASTDDPERARSLAEAGADYIGCGTVYATTTKADAGPVIGIEGLERVAEAVDVPVVGVGGIDAGRSAEIASRTRASGVAVVGAVMRAKDVGDVVRRLMAPWAR